MINALITRTISIKSKTLKIIPKIPKRGVLNLFFLAKKSDFIEIINAATESKVINKGTAMMTNRGYCDRPPRSLVIIRPRKGTINAKIKPINANLFFIY